MKTDARFAGIVSLFISVFMFAAVVPAQQVRMGKTASTRAASKVMRVKSFSGIANKNMVKTPEYKTSINRGIKPVQSWYMIKLVYDTAPEWIDELTIRYYAMTEKKEKGKKNFSIFKTAVRYSDIEMGMRHMGVAYLHPKAMARYGDVVAVAVEVIYKGQVIQEASDVAGGGIPKDWWKNNAVTSSKSVTVRDGYLLSRADSPFAFVNYDDYEFIKE